MNSYCTHFYITRVKKLINHQHEKTFHFSFIFIYSFSFFFRTNSIWAYPVRAYPVRAYPVRAYPVRAYPVRAYPVRAYPVRAYPVRAYPVQTQKEANVKFVYWDKENPVVKFSTDEAKTNKTDVFVAKLVADKVLPGKKYTYEVYVDKKKVNFNYPLEFQTQTLWQWRTDAPAFKFAVGSCTYVNEEAFDRPGKPYGSEYEIFTSIYKSKPDFMVWSGDNTYLREADWNTKTGILHRYTHTRSLPEMQPLLANVHNYAIWDDHDFGPNDSDRGFVSKQQTLDAFKLFWGNLNYAFDNEGVTGSFQWADCQFFLVDDRWWRTPNDRTTGSRDYFGQKQMQWLIDAMKFSNAPFKFVVVGGQVGNPAKIFENYTNYEEERNQFFDLITKEKIPGVIFISGDRHWTALCKTERTEYLSFV